MNTFFENNLKALEKNSPQLAARVRAFKPAGDYEIVVAPDGTRSVQLILGDSKKILLHSKYNPQREAERQLSEHIFGESDNLILLGWGLGYLADTLHKRTNAANTIVIIEKNLGLFYESLSTCDITALLKERSIFFFIDQPLQEFLEFMRDNTLMYFSQEIKLIPHPPSNNIFTEYYAQFRQGIKDFIAYGKLTVSTHLMLPFISVSNELNNLQHYFCRPGVSLVKDKCKGLPAIIVSAGPSLHRNIELLTTLKDRAVIIAVATTLKLLINKGVEPHFSAIIDYHPVSKRYHDGLEKLDTHLIAGACATPTALDAYPGPISFYDSVTLKYFFGEEHEDHGEIPQGATVAHQAFYIAEYLGADPIIFVGQDLGHPDGVTHMPGSPIHEEWAPEFNRFHTIETKEWEQLMRTRDSLIPTEDIHGHRMYTDGQMFAYLQQFYSLFQKSKATIINASEGGALAKHCLIMSLKEAAEKYLTREIPQDLFKYVKQTTWFDEEKHKRLLQIVNRRMQEFRAIREVLNDGLRTLKKVKKDFHDAEKRELAITRARNCNDQIRRYKNVSELLRIIIPADEFHRNQTERRIRAQDLKGTEFQQAVMEMDLQYMAGAAAGIERLIDELEKARKRL